VDAVADRGEQHARLIFELAKPGGARVAARPALDKAFELAAEVAHFVAEHPRGHRRLAIIGFDHSRIENLILHREMGAQDAGQPRQLE